jgi:tRNA 5-methylaminomethyl-2-thiouridine biosynthesis bifunctional protein
MPEVLRPARLAFSEDGTPYSNAYRDIYHAAAGGPGQAEHVFLRGNGLPGRWRDRERFVILETGFGTGLNFLATWATWRADSRRARRLHYIAAEKHPFRGEDLARLHAAWPEFADLGAELRRSWPTLTLGFQRLELDAGRIVLTLLLGDAGDTLSKLRARVDAFYLDGFAPALNPELWSEELCRQLGRLAAPGATLATWSVAGGVRSALAAAGFALEKQPGFGHKREMLTGRHDPPPYRPVTPAPAAPSERRAIVIGAGLAGSACCARLAARGWDCTLIDRHAGPAGEASGNHAGIFHPLLARDDNIPARLTRAAFLHALRLWRSLASAGHTFPWADSGLAQLARDARHESLQRQLPEAMGYPPDYVRFADAAELSRCIGQRVPIGGWLVTHGGWANPAGLCRAYLASAGDRLRTLYRHSVVDLVRDGDQWRALDSDGATLACAPHVVLAAGGDASTWSWTRSLPLQRIRGQVTLLPQGRIPGVALPVCREGYLTPALAGWHCAGASYDADDDPKPRADSDQGNRQRLARLIDADLAGLTDLAACGASSRVGFRAVPTDRLPLVGTLAAIPPATGGGATQLSHLERLEGLHCLLGYASRGIIWSGLMADLLVSRLEAEPLPIEAGLGDALDPGRFLLKRLRKNKGPA